jgi:thioesterase domain-containing protein/acyl carrier protein
VLEKENGEKAAVGEEGEIIAVSPHVSTCYWRKPELTAARFFVDAATGYNGFRTGDVGRWLEDGSIEWLGRKDSMVKIRGQKVILGEVEAALRHAPNIKEGAVALRRDPADDDRVVAYAVPAQPPLDVEHLNTWLMERLPAQALPTAYVELAALPINRNGKTDLRNLPEPDWGKRTLAAPTTAPRDALERKIVDIWREVLRLRELGADDNLFALGAHSILAARALARIEQECGAKLPLSALVQANTPARLAQRIRQGASAPAPASRPIIPLKPAGNKPPLFFVHVLGGGVMNYLPMAQALDPDQPFYAFQAAGFDGECDPHSSIPQMAAHYVAALRQFQPRGPYHLGGHCFGGVVAFEMARQLEAAGERVAQVHLIDAHAPGKPPRSESLAHPLAFAKNLRLWWKANGAGYAAKRLRVAARRNAHQTFGDGTLRLDDVLVAPEAVPDDMVHLLKAQIAAHRAYRAAPIHAPINLYRVALQPLFRAHQKLNGWEKFTSGGVNLHVVQGDHRTVILDTTCAHELARAVTQAHGV